MENNNKKVWIWTAVIVVVLGLGAWYFMRGGTTQNPAENLVSSIRVTDQAANSLSVVIDSATLAVPGFIEIHADNNGAPGAYAGGSNALSAGTYTGYSIIMTTTPGAYYWAMLHKDDGNGIFEAEKDLPIMMNGEPVMARFQVRSATLIDGELDIKG